MLPPFFVSKMHLPIFFPKAVLPKSDHKSFPQEEPPVLQLCPIVLVCDWVVALHILLGILSLVISANWELPTCALTYKLKPRRCDSVTSRKEIVFTNVAAATRDADATCSMKTALCPLSSLTLSSRSTTLPLHLCRCFESSECFGWQRTMGCETNGSPVMFRMLNFFCLGFYSSLKSQAGRFLRLGFGFRNRPRFFHGDGLCTRPYLEFRHRSFFGCLVYSVLMRLSILSCEGVGFVRRPHLLVGGVHSVTTYPRGSRGAAGAAGD